MDPLEFVPMEPGLLGQKDAENAQIPRKCDLDHILQMVVIFSAGNGDNLVNRKPANGP
jgi:hypothetical protein